MRPRGSARPGHSSEGGNDRPLHHPGAAAAAGSVVEVSERGGLLASDSPLMAITPPLEQAPAFDVPAAQAAAVAAVRSGFRHFLASADSLCLQLLSRAVRVDCVTVDGPCTDVAPRRTDNRHGG